MRILQLSCHFEPNVGGVETHLNDLVNALVKRGNKVFVLTYRPITTKTSWAIHETKRGLQIFRIPWIPGLFYKLAAYPILEFIYLFPGLFLVTPIVLLIKAPEVIHGHGLIAGSVAVIWGRVFNRRVILSTHSIYHFPKSGLYRKIAKFIFTTSDFTLGLSRQSADEIKSLGVEKEKVDTFSYWIDLKNFRRVLGAKKRLGWEETFVVLFVGRLVVEKGVRELLHAAKTWNRKISLAIAGTGPLEEEIRDSESENKNIMFLGWISQDDIPMYYSAADLLIIPSVHEEGFGRVILESLACGTPVIGARRGAIPEAMDKTVGRLITVSPQSIKKTVEYFYKNPGRLKRLSSKTRQFARRRYSEKNVEKIIKAYKG